MDTEKYPAHAAMSHGTLARLAAAYVIGLSVAVGCHTAQAAVGPPAVVAQFPSRDQVARSARERALPVLARGTDVQGKPPSAAALKLARRLLDWRISRRLEAELPDLAKPQGPPSPPPAGQGDDFQLWPQRKLVPAPEDPMLAGLRSPFG